MKKVRKILVEISEEITSESNLTLEESTKFVLDRMKYCFSNDIKIVKAEDVEIEEN